MGGPAGGAHALRCDARSGTKTRAAPPWLRGFAVRRPPPPGGKYLTRAAAQPVSRGAGSPCRCRATRPTACANGPETARGPAPPAPVASAATPTIEAAAAQDGRSTAGEGMEVGVEGMASSPPQPPPTEAALVAPALVASASTGIARSTKGPSLTYELTSGMTCRNLVSGSAQVRCCVCL